MTDIVIKDVSKTGRVSRARDARVNAKVCDVFFMTRKPKKLTPKRPAKPTTEYDVAWASLRLILDFNRDLLVLLNRADQAIYAALGKLDKVKP